jgi:pectinesterase
MFIPSFSAPARIAQLPPERQLEALRRDAASGGLEELLLYGVGLQRVGRPVSAAAVFERSEIHIIHPGYLTAQSRTAPTQTTGYVIRNSRVTAADLGGKTFSLGRPWRQYSRVVFIDTELPESLSPQGWNNWGRDPRDTFYAEYGSTGPGARPKLRVPWSHQLTAKEAKQFAPEVFLAGRDKWNPVAEAARLP